MKMYAIADEDEDLIFGYQIFLMLSELSIQLKEKGVDI